MTHVATPGGEHRSGASTGSEFEARTIDAAIEQGLLSLGLERDDVEVVVIEKGSRGFLGLGARLARVRVEPKARVASVVRAMAGEILRLMGVEAVVTARQQGQTVQVRIDGGKEDGLLIGRKGDTLNALEHVITRMACRQTGLGDGVRVQVDVGGYRERREAQVRKMARELAQRVIRTGRRATTEPLTGAERRIVHRALSGNRDVQTHVTGEGASRRVVITVVRGRGRAAEG